MSEAKTCSCPKKQCERHGKCDECIEFHRNNKRPAYCQREKKGLAKLFGTKLPGK